MLQTVSDKGESGKAKRFSITVKVEGSGWLLIAGD